MKRFGRVSRLKLDQAAEYERLHESVWPEVLDAIRRSGISNYSIFRYNEWLFSYFEVPANRPLEEVWKILEDSPACQRWEALMVPLRQAGEAGTWLPMKEVFHL